MFKISPINEKETQRAYATACGAEYNENHFAYAMCDAESGELMGFAQFDINGEYGYISALRPRKDYTDFEAMFILGRATMNFIDMCGAHKCRASRDSAEERLIKSIGFKLDSDEYVCDMAGMFDGHCDGHDVKL